MAAQEGPLSCGLGFAREDPPTQGYSCSITGGPFFLIVVFTTCHFNHFSGCSSVAVSILTLLSSHGHHPPPGLLSPPRVSVPTKPNPPLCTPALATSILLPVSASGYSGRLV